MAAATNKTVENDLMTQTAEQFLEKEVKDPELREILKPHSKCKYCFSVARQSWNADIIKTTASDLSDSTTSIVLSSSPIAQSFAINLSNIQSQVSLPRTIVLAYTQNGITMLSSSVLDSTLHNISSMKISKG
jgi:hypothetical protein